MRESETVEGALDVLHHHLFHIWCKVTLEQHYLNDMEEQVYGHIATTPFEQVSQIRECLWPNFGSSKNQNE